MRIAKLLSAAILLAVEKPEIAGKRRKMLAIYPEAKPQLEAKGGGTKTAPKSKPKLDRQGRQRLPFPQRISESQNFS